jgi:exopolysaccharide biosynthesis polyprenyl glycosylphosphotransferase
MRRQLRFLLYKPIVVAFDVLLVNVSYGLTCLLVSHSVADVWATLLAYRHLVLSISLTTAMVFYLLDLYRNWPRKSAADLVPSVMIAVGITSTITMAYAFWSHQFAIKRGTFVVSAGIQIALISIYRLIARRIYKAWLGGRSTVVVGESRLAAETVATKLSRYWDGWYSVMRCIARADLKAPYRELEDAETVILVEISEKSDLIRYSLRHHKEVLVVPNLFDLTFLGAEPREVDDLLLFKVRTPHFEPAQELLKRTMDILGALALFVVTSPLLSLALILVPLTSKGSALFRQQRIGKGGVPFNLFKFRTMVSNAESLTGPVLATDRDSRITPLGRFLRATRIDELPQLFNVLRGEMSLIGPRPERPVFVQQFERDWPGYALRHSVKPGLTGLAQIRGRYSTKANGKLHFDLLYIYNYSLLLDCKILLQTIRVVLLRDQARGLKVQDLPSNGQAADWLMSLHSRYKKGPATSSPTEEKQRTTGVVTSQCD